MEGARSSEPVRVAAHAKVNLRLRVLGRGEDGYHALETLFLRLALRDEVEIRTGSRGIRLQVEREPGPVTGLREPQRPVPAGPENLCWMAAEAYYGALGREPNVDLLLRKRLPAGAGLGGGSADAAAVLRGLEALHEGALGDAGLQGIAGGLGSDVPFHLADTEAALGWERGRRLLPLAAPAARPMLVVVPGFRVATPEAYAWLDEEREGDGAGAGAPDETAFLFPPAGRLGRWEELAELAVNDFEAPVFARHPELRGWKEALLGAGARPALLAGSGSALFGVFPDEETRDAGAARLEAEDGVAVIRTRGPV